MWHSTLAVFQPDGTEIGTLESSEDITPGSAVDLDVTSDISIALAVDNHPLEELRGIRKYSIETDLKLLTYQGPDILGTVRLYGEDVIHGRVFWPQAGFNMVFTEIAVNETRFLINQKYYRANEMIANVFGYKTSDEAGEPFSGAKWAGYASERWQGTKQSFALNGGPLSKKEMIERRYYGLRFEDFSLEEEKPQRLTTLELELWAPYYIVSGSMLGVAKLYGWSLEFECANGPTEILQGVEMYDPISEAILGLHTWHTSGMPERIDVIYLDAQE